MFETSADLAILTPPHMPHDRRVQVAGVYGGARSDLTEARTIRRGGYVPKDKRVRAELMGVDPDSFTLHGLSEGIPPVYATWVASSFLAAAAERAA